MPVMTLPELYQNGTIFKTLETHLQAEQARVSLTGTKGSMLSVLGATMAMQQPDNTFVFIVSSKEDAFYLYNDLETLLDDKQSDLDHKRVHLFPTSYRRPYQHEETDNANVLQRSEVVKQMTAGRSLVVVTYPEALSEKVVSRRTLVKHMLQLTKGAATDMDFVVEMLQEYEFERVDFVVEPGQYAVRGGIVDIFSYGSEQPYRAEFFDDKVDSLRLFDPSSQLTVTHCDSATILPNLAGSQAAVVEERVCLLHYLSSRDEVWAQALLYCSDILERELAAARTAFASLTASVKHTPPEQMYCSANEMLADLVKCKVVEWGNAQFFSSATQVEMHGELQPVFNKQFDLLIKSLQNYVEQGYIVTIGVTGEQQQHRLERIFAEFPSPDDGTLVSRHVQFVPFTLQGGFIDHDLRLLYYTDHEIFERYHKYTVRDLRKSREAMTLKELFELKPGDYVTHIDFGVGRFAGLEKVETGGRTQEVIRLVYKNNDTLYISIHGLHKISRYVGKEGVPPVLNRLGSPTWQTLKQRTKKQVKDIAKDLIALYAKRKASQGFAFSADSYLQNELEASFMYEDTPDQSRATHDVKTDMESRAPMDRLVCGDVGFGKTEVAIRAAFKAVCDSKQVAVLVPSTILAFQHYNTFCDRLKGLPVNVEYLNRFRTAKEKTRIMHEVETGKIDILIGTHAITNSKIKFKDLGLLIIDEEQKFGVSVKEKLRQLKVNVDCLTLTATPIPRTLQFSLMGARDLSVIQTPPPNRQPIETELVEWNEETLRDAVHFEMSRGGQTFFISNRVENLTEMAGMVNRLVPDARIGIAHGQMDGKKVEETLMQFMEGDLDVLVATSIIENGLDVPGANTMLVMNAHQFGLSDLHQMRGRVGRSNKKAFCYLFIPSFASLTEDARRRLNAIEQFSTIGSGFNIAMRDLDIRGAGNILGAEQSGFISEMGYDMYQKILNEAILELKETDFKELFQQEMEESGEYVQDCTIETDLSAMLPDDYVTSVSERLLLYRELSGLETEEELDAYRERLIDRFGPLPRQTGELILTVRLRRLAKHIGIEKVVLKQGNMVCHFVANQDNPFFKSSDFMRMIRYASAHPAEVSLRETTDRLTLRCSHVESMRAAIERLEAMSATSPSSQNV
ncbi:MAG: transcription-repair coupling factor [Bacteroidales bacterium]|nr:transcription-repair coupling factor [Bacteroidales bacterium]